MEAHPQEPKARRSPVPRPQRLLTIYLNDHLAGASGGVSLIHRMARTHRGTPAGAPLAELAREIAEDRESLREIMTALDVPERWPRVVMGRLAEKAARVKLNGRLVRRSPLSDVLELEAMRLGVEGKASLWRSLETLAATTAPLAPATVDRLLSRAQRQAAVLEELRVEAAGRTFTADAADGTVTDALGVARRRPA
ncbi:MULTISPECIES: hypothetical protein [unclassified Streptomyces]|uniref:hypothetical protein n=1 Tax=unclassified Streptomyces TaxID=2593676 RepID=UPI0022569BF4|nr:MULTISPECIES: hypothetical protein [unclassified Streptomyces]MCX4524157.1 hypothetical protein [Streptomyces sp. NBC_01551]MCX4545324.1 hypothetical protein [Streptomyces sp. NBC_01565]